MNKEQFSRFTELMYQVLTILMNDERYKDGHCTYFPIALAIRATIKDVPEKMCRLETKKWGDLWTGMNLKDTIGVNTENLLESSILSEKDHHELSEALIEFLNFIQSLYPVE